MNMRLLQLQPTASVCLAIYVAISLAGCGGEPEAPSEQVQSESLSPSKDAVSVNAPPAGSTTGTDRAKAKHQATTDEIALLPLVRVEDCTLRGDVHRENESLRLGPSDSAFEIPLRLPESYTLTLHIKRTSSRGGLVLWLPFGAHRAEVVLDCLRGSGIQSVGLQTYHKGSAAVSTPTTLTDGKEHALVITVKHDSVSVNLDSTELMRFRGTGRRRVVGDFFRPPNRTAVSVRSLHAGNFVISNITARCDGTVEPLLPAHIVTKDALAQAAEIHGDAVLELAPLIAPDKEPLSTRSSHDGTQLLSVSRANFDPFTSRLIQVIAQLKGPIALRYSHLSSNEGATLEDFKLISQMPNLRYLDLWNRHIVDKERMKYLSRCPSLEHVVLDYQHMSSEELQSLCQIKTLRALSLDGVGLDDRKLSTIVESLPNLEILSVGKNTITNDAIVALKELKNLTELHAYGCSEITDAVLPHLADCRKLQFVSIDGTSITEDGYERLSALLPETIIAWKHPAESSTAQPVTTAAATTESKQTQDSSESSPSNTASVKQDESGSESLRPAVADKVTFALETRPRYPRTVKRQIDRVVSTLQKSLSDRDIESPTILVGRVLLNGVDEDRIHEHIAMQCDLLDGGYFVTAIESRDKPLLIAAHGYIPVLGLCPKLAAASGQVKQSGIIHLQTITLKPVTSERSRIISGSVTLTPFTSTTLCMVTAVPVIDNHINSPFVDSSDKPPVSLMNNRLLPIIRPLNYGGGLHIPDCAPMPYRVSVSRAGYSESTAVFDGLELHPEELELHAISKDAKQPFTVRKLRLDDFPGNILSSRLMPLKKKLEAPATISGYERYLVAGRITPPSGRRLDESSLSVTLSGSTFIRGSFTSAYGYIFNDGWFCSASTVFQRRIDEPTDVLRIRALGFAPIDIRFDSSYGNLILVEITPESPKPEDTRRLEWKCTDSDGKPLAGATVHLRFFDAVRYAITDSSAGWQQILSDRKGTAHYDSLTPGWYSWTAVANGRRQVRGSIFLNADSPKTVTQTIEIPFPRIIELDYVESKDDSGTFKSEKTKRMTLTEGTYLTFNRTVAQPGRVLSDRLIVIDTGTDGLTFVPSSTGVSREQWAWIANVGEADLKSVTDAKKWRPTPSVSRQGTKVRCREGDVYVMGTHASKHIKFRVREIRQP